MRRVGRYSSPPLWRGVGGEFSPAPQTGNDVTQRRGRLVRASLQRRHAARLSLAILRCLAAAGVPAVLGVRPEVLGSYGAGWSSPWYIVYAPHRTDERPDSGHDRGGVGASPSSCYQQATGVKPGQQDIEEHLCRSPRHQTCPKQRGCRWYRGHTKRPMIPPLASRPPSYRRPVGQRIRSNGIRQQHRLLREPLDSRTATHLTQGRDIA
jgi:hypothetical protein